ncbi:MAG: glutamate synthase large subunit [Candidatus Goldbacteria bacterium]|nr:glutamate synthase large subunit [Candidatus Goldiibacteriota bacterium]
MKQEYKNTGLYDESFERDSCGVGFFCNIKGEKSNYVLKSGLTILKRLTHRGAVGADPKTGDGAGILIQIPDEFFKKVSKKDNIRLPENDIYGVGLIFLPEEKESYNICKKIIIDTIKEKKQILLGFRKVPVDDSVIGEVARNCKPLFEQVFIGKGADIENNDDFERKLFIIRKIIENKIRKLDIKDKKKFYITNLSCRTIIYKGLMMPEQIENFFIDLKDENIKTAICLVHSRYSTNTFPTWDLAQPFRMLAHNGEINTLRGNLNWMKSREGLFENPLFGSDIENIKPVIRDENQSDSASLDNAFELLYKGGRELEHSILMLIPEAWEHNKLLPNSIRSFYKYHACLMEPWDGPAAVAFTDGIRIGAILDRNGLRPARYIITKDDYVVMASEVGVLDIPSENIKYSGRLEPGKIFYIDTLSGRIIDNDEIKEKLAKRAPYRQWRKEQLVYIEDLPEVKSPNRTIKNLHNLLKAFGYTREDLNIIIKPMADEAKDPTGSMGNDTPHSVLSKRPKMLSTYFKQLFAQVTNPAIDSIRESIVMSLRQYLGPQKNIFAEIPEHTHKLQLKEPILTKEEFLKIQNININGFKAKTIYLLIIPGDKEDFINALNRICEEAEKAIKEGYSFIILSDNGVTEEYAAIPALLAAGAVHHHLVKKSLRCQCSIIVESGEPRELHDMCVLFGYGVDAIYPYLAYETIKYMVNKGELSVSYEKAIENYRKTLHKGILKVMSKMGISTLNSYKGAQIFEALGIHKEVIDKCFTGTVSRIGGVGFEEIVKETFIRHSEAFSKNGKDIDILETGGIYQWKKDGEKHLWNPETISALQDSVKNGDYEKFKKFTELVDNQKDQPVTLRGLLKFKKQNPIPLDEVEPEQEIIKRFAVGAMSFGSISKYAHETIAIAMNRLGAKSNTGEGGEDPERFKKLPNGDWKRSAIKQVASGRFGVTINYLTNAEEIQIKIAQGAKPGEGGQLPGHKVSEIIAKTRYTTPGVTLISPPPHHDIYSIEDLKQLIFDLKNANPEARISVKLVAEPGVGTVAAGVAKAHADMILISGGDGGTGASPKASIMHAGLPWELGLAETHQTLVLNDLRSRVRLQTDGQLRTGKDIIVAACLGAEEYGFGTTALVVLGCVMLRHCHLNNCALGVATQDPILQERFPGKPEYLENYFKFLARQVREIMASLGIKTINELIGRTDLLEVDYDILPWKAKNIDFSKILWKPTVQEKIDVYCTKKQDHEIDDILDKKLISLTKNALDKKEKVKIELEIKNINRTTGTMLSYEVCKRYGEEYLPEDTIWCHFRGVAGQSFGAWLAKGITFELEGMANDYVGKGITGGKIIIYPDRNSDIKPEENIIIGNTTFYGAIKGEAYINGVAGERFCIRNSGVHAVVEGVGDHGCEYMTGGVVLVLGKTGRNFAAGMSGGVAFVYDIEGNFREKCNLEMVELETLDKNDIQLIKDMCIKHYEYTKSKRAEEILNNFDYELKKFIKVFPTEYKNLLRKKVVKEKAELQEVLDG